MRYFTLILITTLTACATAQAAPEEEACADIAITELPPIEIVFPARTIEIAAGRKMTDGVLSFAICFTEDEDRSIDYSGCCPDGWHALALGANGLICEED